VSELRRHLPGIRPRLTRWLRDAVPVQPCLCDIWHDHVLYTGDRVTGLVDFGSVKDDHVACDLARLLGSLVGGDARLRAAGIEAYRRVRPLADAEVALIDDLDWTGTIVAAANWLRWLYVQGRHYPDRDAVARRLAVVLRRLETG
jgi:Ser/Thr protein kinase RdoA (MazF antagonist)